MKVALAQLRSTPDVDANLAICRELAQRAADRQVRWLLFPENAPFLGHDRDKLAHLSDLDGPLVEAFAEMAREAGIWITLGSFPERAPQPDKSYNTCVVLTPSGTRAAVYRKIHLFDVDLRDGTSLRESEAIAAGDRAVVVDIDGWRVGLSICYDLRFPELYRALVSAGAEILTVPSAFTLQTGPHHWHPLLRARAIENQCYVLAPNQWGHHLAGRDSFGHSAVYGPWGHQMACALDEVTLITADLSREHLEAVRRQIPCLAHRRAVDELAVDLSPQDG